VQSSSECLAQCQELQRSLNAAVVVWYIDLLTNVGHRGHCRICHHVGTDSETHRVASCSALQLPHQSLLKLYASGRAKKELMQSTDPVKALRGEHKEANVRTVLHRHHGPICTDEPRHDPTNVLLSEVTMVRIRLACAERPARTESDLGIPVGYISTSASGTFEIISVAKVDWPQAPLS
jgi:hypothetical protein